MSQESKELAPEPNYPHGAGTPPAEPRQKWQLVMGVILALLLAINVVHFLGDAGSSDLEGTEAPNFGLPVLGEARSEKLSDHASKVVVLDFWATWCPPCRKQMPVLQKLHEDMAQGGDAVVLGINTDEPGEGREAQVQAFMQANGYTMTTLLDNGPVSRMYRVRAIPTLVVVGTDGRIHYWGNGEHPRAELDRLIAEARAQAP